jgi:hypothetical protein
LVYRASSSHETSLVKRGNSEVRPKISETPSAGRAFGLFLRTRVATSSAPGSWIDHGARETHELVDPSAELGVPGIREVGEPALQDAPVVRQVVAGEQRYGSESSQASAVEALGEVAVNGARFAFASKIAPHVRMIEIEPGRGVGVITALGDRERDDLRLRRGNGFENELRIGRGVQVLDDRPDHASRALFGVSFDEGVETVPRA